MCALWVLFNLMNSDFDSRLITSALRSAVLNKASGIILAERVGTVANV